MTKTVFAMSLAGITLIATTAFAIEIDPAVDTDGDGLYSFPELTEAYAEMNEELFVAIDANADGAIDAEEMVAAQDAALLPVTDG